MAAGTGDNMAAALGLGLRAGDVVVSLGTSGVVFAVSDNPANDPTGSVAGFADASGRFLPLVCTLNATKVTEWARRLLGVDHAGLDALAMGAAPGAGGLTLLPYLDGERTPNRPGASGVLSGIRSDTSPEHVARAAFEGVGCSMFDAFDALSAQVATDGRVFLVGGGARSAAYRQIIADLFGRPVLVPVDDEAVAAGACVQAAAMLEQIEPADVAARWSASDPTAFTTVVPGPGAEATERIRAAYADRRDREA